MEGETKTARIDQKSTSVFYLFVFFFLKIQDIRKSKTPIFERGSHKTFLGQLLTIFQTSSNNCSSKFCKIHRKASALKSFEYSCRLIKFTKFARKHLCWNLDFNQVAVCRYNINNKLLIC